MQSDACLGKRSYPDFVTCRRMAERTSRGRDTPTQPYRCKHCGHWHVGASNRRDHKPPREVEYE